MRNLLIILTLGVLISCNQQDPNNDSFDISFQRENYVVVHRFKDGKELKFKDGYDPAISPDGNKLAYTKSQDSENDFIRYIVVVDLRTKNETKMNVNNENYYGASWSPDNSKIAFNIFNGNNWAIGYINSDNTGLQVIKANSNMGLYQPTWTSDSKNIITHNMQKIFKFNLSGIAVDSIDLEKEIGDDYFVSSASIFLLTSNNRLLIFNCGTDETMTNVEGGVEAIFTFDIKNKVITRLSPPNIYAIDLNIESDNNIIFCGYKENENQPSIYRIDLSTNKVELIMKNASRPTMSRNRQSNQHS